VIGEARSVKCVVWDLDDTVWDGVAAYASDERLPASRPGVLAAIDKLAAAGVLSSIASRTDPSVADAVRADPELNARFLAPRIGWQDKSESLRQISAELGIGLDSLAFVDDSPYERAEVRSMLPEVLVLAPEDVTDLVEELSSGPVTSDARHRFGRYREELLRREAGERFPGSREDFLRNCGMRLVVGKADTADTAEIERFVELAARTHRLSSDRLALTTDDVQTALASGSHPLFVAYLSDRYGDYGLIGAAFVAVREPVWCIDLLTLSCRIAGRGVSAAFLGWVIRQAALAGASQLRLRFRPTSANLELRVLLRQVGMHSSELEDHPAVAGETRILALSLAGELPAGPEWVEVAERKMVTT
jgi:FkbH-like protein